MRRYTPRTTAPWLRLRPKAPDETDVVARHNGLIIGTQVSIRPDLWYILIRRRAKGHGHVVVYRFDDQQVSVLYVFHTAQDWQARLAKS